MSSFARALVYLGLFLLLSGGFVLGAWGVLLGVGCMLAGWAQGPLGTLLDALFPRPRKGQDRER